MTSKVGYAQSLPASLKAERAAWPNRRQQPKQKQETNRRREEKHSMKTNRKQKQKILKPSGAFTLIEMIGVLAVIAILAALLIPKVYEAINNARVNNAAVSCETVKTALADHYAKFNALNVDGSQTPPVVIPNANMPALIDPILLKEQFLDKLFQVKIGDGTFGSNTTAHVEVNVCPLAV